MTVTATTASRAPFSTLARAVVAAPERIVLIAVSLSLAAGALVSLGLHQPWTVLPLAAVLSAVGWRTLPAARPRTQADVVAAWILLVGVLAYAVVAVAMAAEYLIVVRDPGFLSLSGMWLVDHPHTDIPLDGARAAAAVSGDFLPDAPEAWNARGDVLQPQGAKMLPATIAIGGWVAGATGVLAANPVIGAVGLLATYSAGRRFLGPLAALAPAAAIAVSASHIGLSRSAYTEPLTLLLGIAALAWAWTGLRERRIGPLVWAAATTGATAFIRIDGALLTTGMVVAVAFALATGDQPRWWRRRAMIAFALTQAAITTAGYLALLRWSEEYLARLGDRTAVLTIAYVALAAIIAGWAATWTDGTRGDRVVAVPARALGRRGAIITGALVTVTLVLLASRPLWTTVHRGTDTAQARFANGVVEGFQRAAGADVDGTRTYAEHTITWLSYYLTWPLVALGILGFGLAAFRMLRRDPAWALLLGGTLAPALLYIWSPAIIPDQIWAVRRFEPSALPGFALAAAAAAWWLASLLPHARWRRAARRGAGVGFVVLPLLTWVSIVPGDPLPVSTATPVTTREMIGARDQLNDLCAVVDGRPVVLVGTASHFGSLRVTCDVPVVLALRAPTAEALDAVADVLDQHVVVLTRDPDEVPWTTAPEPVVESTVSHTNYELQRIPRTLITRNYNWYAGVVTPAGTVEPLRAP